MSRHSFCNNTARIFGICIVFAVRSFQYYYSIDINSYLIAHIYINRKHDTNVPVREKFAIYATVAVRAFEPLNGTFGKERNNKRVKKVSA